MKGCLVLETGCQTEAEDFAASGLVSLSSKVAPGVTKMRVFCHKTFFSDDFKILASGYVVPSCQQKLRCVPGAFTGVAFIICSSAVE